MAFISRLFLAAIGAGLIAGLLVSVVQLGTTVPLIAAAEVYESGAAPAVHEHADGESHVHATPGGEDGGLARHALTFIANMVIGAGCGLFLAALMALHGGAIDARRGVLWGAAGFAALMLAPALGLPPELPGSAAAELGARQAWYLLAVLCTGGGLWLIAFAPRLIWLGLALLVVPHLLGAPHPPTLEGAAPAGLAAHFAVASLVTGALFWLTLGAAAGWLLGRGEGEGQRLATRG
ncbi:MAG: CbtA family protein [Geminicoccaceae bacterium]|nr:CbtA family protein [Geminicoccaceae bacterium]